MPTGNYQTTQLGSSGIAIFWLGALAIVAAFLTLFSLLIACFGATCSNTRPRLIGAIAGAVPGTIIGFLGFTVGHSDIRGPHGPPLGPIIGSVFAISGLVSMIIGGTFGAWLGQRQHARETSGLRCPNCEYDLRGLTERRCPECGHPF